MEFALEETWK